MVQVGPVAALDRALRAIAPANVVTGVLAVADGALGDVHPTEAALVASAVDRRRREFAAGRQLLHRLTGTSDAILRGPDGAPAVPAGWRATLAHDDTVAVAAASCDPAVTALGIDVEPDTPLDADLAHVILREDERDIDAHQAFCLKEAVYKAWSTGGGAMLDFHDVRLELAGGTDRFRAVVIPAQRAYSGHWANPADRWLALVVEEPAVLGRRGLPA